jgi:hypothetical protein
MVGWEPAASLSSRYRRVRVTEWIADILSARAQRDLLSMTTFLDL